jgi:hypothetical protein
VQAHAEFSPSASARWINCPGSVELSKTCPKPPTSEKSQAGTNAHLLAEQCFRTNLSAQFFVGQKLGDFEVDAYMAKQVQRYLDYVRLISYEEKAELHIEKTVYPIIGHEHELFGTADCLAVTESTLDVVDLKFGEYPVSPEFNTQLMLYALGGINMFWPDQSLDTLEIGITIHIHQPRVLKTGLGGKSFDISMHAIRAFKTLVTDSLRQARAGTVFASGGHCRFCPAELVCPELNKMGRMIL